LEVEGADVMQVSDDHLLLEDGKTTTNVDSPEKVQEKRDKGRMGRVMEW
jgi:hypothetical protein